MASQFPEWQIANFREAFSKFDTNNDGTVTCAELGTLLEDLGEHMTETSLRNMIREFDIDDNGSIEFDEFIQMLSDNMKDTDFDEKMNSEFRSYDQNSSGYITASQLRTAMAKNCDTITDGEFDEWLHHNHIKDNDKIQYNKFFERKRSIQLMPNQFTKEQLSSFKGAFNQFDANGDGTITPEELGKLMKSVGIFPSETGLKNMMDEFDTNGDGIIDYLEFLTIVARDWGDDTDFEKMVNKAFHVYDKNNAGFVTASQLRTVMAEFCDTMTDGEFDELLQEANIKDTDLINYKQYFTRKHSIVQMPQIRE